MAGLIEDIEFKYEDFTADLDDKGFPSPRVVVPLIAILIVLVIGAAAYTALVPQAAATIELSVQVKDASDSPISGAVVKLQNAKGETIEEQTTDTTGVIA